MTSSSQGLKWKLITNVTFGNINDVSNPKHNNNNILNFTLSCHSRKSYTTITYTIYHLIAISIL